jgi:HK97 gp10 family phage protein
MKEVFLKSRLPEIVAELPARLDGVAKAGAELVCASAKERAPYDAHKSPGDPHLRDALHVEKVKVGTYAVVAGDSDVFWGHLVENGTTHSAAEPFLIPALEEDKPEVVSLAEAAARTI